MEEQKNSFSIKLWAQDDRPREKLLAKGISSLSDAELLAILIGSGSKAESAVDLSKRILSSIDNNLNVMAKLSVTDLMKFKGIGEAKAITVVTALELGRRRRMEESVELANVKDSHSIYQVMQPIIGELNREEFWIIYLNNSHKIIHKSQLSTGGITGTVVDVRLVFKKAVELHATAIILCHNHPSGNTKPSESDIQLTKKMKLGGETLDVKVLDHIIVTENAYFSFADEGLL